MSGQPLRGPVKILCRVNRVKLRSYSGRISQIQQVRKKDIPIEGASCKRGVAVDASLLGHALRDVLALQLRGS